MRPVEPSSWPRFAGRRRQPLGTRCDGRAYVPARPERVLQAAEPTDDLVPEDLESKAAPVAHRRIGRVCKKDRQLQEGAAQVATVAESRRLHEQGGNVALHIGSDLMPKL